jgi:four helix bundle protein
VARLLLFHPYGWGAHSRATRRLATGDRVESAGTRIHVEAKSGQRHGCRQIRRSSRSTPANIAEGFRRFRPRDFARFLAIAKASLGETQNHLREGLQATHLTVEEFSALWSLSWRAMIAISRLHSYLRNCDDPG